MGLSLAAPDVGEKPAVGTQCCWRIFPEGGFTEAKEEEGQPK